MTVPLIRSPGLRAASPPAHSCPAGAEAAQFLADGTMIAAIEGQDSCCLITEQSSTEHQFCLLGKENNRYRLLAASEWNSENIRADDGMAVTILSANGTSDYYAYGTFFEPAGRRRGANRHEGW